MRMKIYLSPKRNRGMTLIEAVVFGVALGLLAVFFFLPMVESPHCTYTFQVACANNLRQVGLAARIWAMDNNDNNDKFPMEAPETNGATMEFVTGPNAFRHFQVMSNGLSTPKIIFFRAEPDADRVQATNFDIGNSNVSYFIGVDATQSKPVMILFGDHSLTNGAPVRNGVMELVAKRRVSWADEVHEHRGNIALADGSLQQIKTAGLRKLIRNSGAATNRLQMPWPVQRRSQTAATNQMSLPGAGQLPRL